MGSNRKRPFGYKMELGEIVLHPAEAETVRWIYDSYLAGASYNALVDKLRERGIPYDGDKPWNKNMAARILSDRRYTGESGYPPIIPEGQFQRAQTRRQERTTPSKKTPAQKELRKLCGGGPPAWVERQVLSLLNRRWTPLGRRSMKPSASEDCSRGGHSWRNWNRRCSTRASAASPSVTGRSPSC